jgi:hypothetical protein
MCANVRKISKNVRDVRKCAGCAQMCGKQANMCGNVRKCIQNFCARYARTKILSHVRSSIKFVRAHTPHIEFQNSNTE